jgi:K(+)-stimulated pyrophosphate-energized sodium pump
VFSRMLRHWRGARVRTAYLVLMAVVFGGAFLWSVTQGQDTGKATDNVVVAEAFRWFAPLLDYHPWERASLLAVLGVAVLGLIYAGTLVRQIKRADQGTKRMQEIADAVREGANAYMAAQFRKIGPLIILLTVVLYLTKMSEPAFAFGRAGSFLVGSLFSWLVGFVGMRLATTGNLRVAAAARWATAPARSRAC